MYKLIIRHGYLTHSPLLGHVRERPYRQNLPPSGSKESNLFELPTVAAVLRSGPWDFLSLTCRIYLGVSWLTPPGAPSPDLIWLPLRLR